MANYATATDLINRYSPAVLGDLASDDGTRVAEGSLSANAKIQMALATATGKVKASILQGARYTPAQITAMTTSGDPAYDAESAAFLADITCRVAFWLLWQRKPWSDQHENQRKQAEADSESQLDRLRKGVEIFNIGGAVEAGVPSGTGMTAVQSQYSWAARARGRFYPNNYNLNR